MPGWVRGVEGVGSGRAREDRACFFFSACLFVRCLMRDRAVHLLKETHPVLRSTLLSHAPNKAPPPCPGLGVHAWIGHVLVWVQHKELGLRLECLWMYCDPSYFYRGRTKSRPAHGPPPSLHSLLAVPLFAGFQPNYAAGGLRKCHTHV